MRTNKTDKAIRIASRILVALILFVMWMRVRDYRTIIYDYQRTADTYDTALRTSAQERIERKIGRANYPYDRLPKRPRYPHFWDDYNAKSTESRQQQIFD